MLKEEGMALPVYCMENLTDRGASGLWSEVTKGVGPD